MTDNAITQALLSWRERLLEELAPIRSRMALLDAQRRPLAERDYHIRDCLDRIDRMIREVKLLLPPETPLAFPVLPDDADPVEVVVDPEIPF